jgi:hypothetical protein
MQRQVVLGRKVKHRQGVTRKEAKRVQQQGLALKEERVGRAGRVRRAWRREVQL